MPRAKSQEKIKYEMMIRSMLNEMGFKYETEYKFHPTRKWRFDYAFPEHKVAIEFEGALWVKGRHRTGIGFLGDCEKYNAATLMGWRVIRITSEHLNGSERRAKNKVTAFEDILKEIAWQTGNGHTT